MSNRPLLFLGTFFVLIGAVKLIFVLIAKAKQKAEADNL